MAKICGKWRIYLGIGLSAWETAKLFGKWRRSVGNVSNIWGNDLIIWQTLKNVENDLEIYMVHGLTISETAWLSWKCLKKLTND